MNLSSSLIPYPASVERAEGALLFFPEIAIAYAPPFQRSAELFAERVRANTGWPCPTHAIGAEGDALVQVRLVQDPAIANPEAYSLTIDDKAAQVTASGAPGAYYGMQTLLQLLPPAIFGDGIRAKIENNFEEKFGGIQEPLWQVPRVKIEDAPRFRWRGVMLDSSRHFQPIEWIQKFIDVLSQHKFNVFHWHLTDHQAWRVEIKKYPRLTEVGSKGSYSGTDANPFGIREEASKGRTYYTQVQIRALVAYAAERHISIMPEIDLPGHCQSVVTAYPELGITGPLTAFGQPEAVLNARPETLTFVRDVLTEVISLFPYPYLHVGGDEVDRSLWKNDLQTQERMRELGLADEGELGAWFINQMGEFLRGEGRKLVGYDEILEGNKLPPEATVMSWRSAEAATAAAELGHDSIMSQGPPLYFIRYQGTIGSEPVSNSGYLPLETLHQYDPVPKDMPKNLRGHLLGVQGHLWTEFMATIARLEYQAFPQICTLAEVAWSPLERPSYSDFLRRLVPHLRRLDCQDVGYRAPMEDLLERMQD